MPSGLLQLPEIHKKALFGFRLSYCYRPPAATAVPSQGTPAHPPLVLGSSFLSLLFIRNDKIRRGFLGDFSAEMNQFGYYNFKNGIITPLVDPG